MKKNLGLKGKNYYIFVFYFRYVGYDNFNFCINFIFWIDNRRLMFFKIIYIIIS